MRKRSLAMRYTKTNYFDMLKLFRPKEIKSA